MFTNKLLFQPKEAIPIKVIAKCRPMLEEEKQKGAKTIVKVTSDRVSIDAAGKVCI